MPVLECLQYENKSVDQMAALFQEVYKRFIEFTNLSNHFVLLMIKIALEMIETALAKLFQKTINLSIISPRKIPLLIKIFEKADGDVSSMNKDFSKDPRHLVLLKGYR